MKLSLIAKNLNLSFKGDPDKEIFEIRDLERLFSSESIISNAIYYVENQHVLKKRFFIEGKAVVLTTEVLGKYFKNAIMVPQKLIRLSFIQLLNLFSKKPKFNKKQKILPGLDSFIHESAKVSESAIIMPQAVIMENAEITDGVIIHPHVVVGTNAKIGKQTVLHPGVVIGYNCRIGEHCIIYGGSIIGTDGFGYYDYEGKRYKVPQISHVEIHDYVEIGANSSIDRGTIEPTIIGAHTKIDNQVQIGHNCVVGKYVFMAGNVGVSGSVNIGDGAVLGGKVGIADHLNIAEGSVIMAGSGLHFDTKPKNTYFGYPARVAREAHRINSAIPYLPELLKRIKELEKKVYGKNNGD